MRLVRAAATRGVDVPPAYSALVAATREPFLQGIFDLTVPAMVQGRIALIGDAAFIPRPHTAASTAKAAANAIALARGLSSTENDIPRALRIWESAQLALGMNLYRRGKALGDRSQFPGGRRPYPADVRPES